MMVKMCMYLYDLSCDILVYCYILDERCNGEAIWAPAELKAVLHPNNPYYTELAEKPDANLNLTNAEVRKEKKVGFQFDTVNFQE